MLFGTIIRFFHHKNRLPPQFHTSSFIQTVLLVLELHQICAEALRGLYRQSGISPCPEDLPIQMLDLLYLT